MSAAARRAAGRRAPARVVVLAAGRGTRLGAAAEGLPKCMVELAGRPLLDHQLAAFAACGVDDVHVVTGHAADRVVAPGATRWTNPRYADTNMVVTLFCAQDAMDGTADLVVSYGDIVYEPRVLEALLAVDAPLAIVVDRGWRDYWQARMPDPLADAETMRLADGDRIVELGRRATSYDQVEGQYIGLFRVRADHVPAFVAAWDALDPAGPYDGRDRDHMFMTSFLQRLIDTGWDARAAFVEHGWLEVDQPEDLAIDTSRFFRPVAAPSVPAAPAPATADPSPPPALRAVLVLPSLAAGGAERVVLALAGGLARAGDRVDLVVVDGRGPFADRVPDGVRVVDLAAPRLLAAVPRLVRALRRLRPDVVVASATHVNLVLLALRRWLGRDVRVVVREAATPSRSLAEEPFPRLFAWGMRRWYRRAAAVVASSSRMRDELIAHGAPAGAVTVLANPVDVAAIRAAAVPPRRRPGPGRRLVTVGRLVEQKGVDRVIDALAGAAADTHLTVVGDGPERDALEARARARGVADRVAFVGFVDPPWPWIAGADALVIASRWEGMPNVALEALACGTPVVAVDEAGGIDDLAASAPAGAVRVVEVGGLAGALDAVAVRAADGLGPSLVPAAMDVDRVVDALRALLVRTFRG